MVCMEECWPDLGGRVLAAPRGQPELLLLSGLSVTEVGIQGGGRKLPSRAGWLGPTATLIAAKGRNFIRPASKVKPGFLPAAANQECLPAASSWLNQLQCKESSLVSAMKPICQSAIKDFRLYKKKRKKKTKKKQERTNFQQDCVALEMHRFVT